VGPNRSESDPGFGEWPASGDTRMRPSWPGCQWCGGPAKPGPRGGFRPRCADCEQERLGEMRQPQPARASWYEQNRAAALQVARARRIRAGQPVVRLCQRCGDPATSSRHQLCDTCRARPHPTRSRTRSAPREQLSRRLRGYNAAHDRLRASWVPRVKAGGVACGRCGRLIEPGTPWDLGHPGDDKRLTPVPWHRRCNRQFAASVTRPRRTAERKATR
jgi:hypothetical protein